MLQLITDATTPEGVFEQAASALVGGCRWIQIRMKGAAEDVILEAARLVSPHAKVMGATLLLDDNVELVAANPQLFDGVHVGRNDMPPTEARRILGPGPIIGATVNTLDDILALRPWDDVNYLGMGPYRYTTTKANPAPTLGVSGYGETLAEARRYGFTLPVVAIGGITVADLPLLAQTGIAGIAVSGSINHAPDPIAATRAFMAGVRKYFENQ